MNEQTEQELYTIMKDNRQVYDAYGCPLVFTNYKDAQEYIKQAKVFSPHYTFTIKIYMESLIGGLYF